MYGPLKARLWKEIDARLYSTFSCKPDKRSATWRLYRLQAPIPYPFITVEYLDTAGGKFSFAFGLSRGALPTPTDTPSRTLDAAVAPFTVAYGDALGVPHALVSVELDWQSPSAALVKQASAVPAAKALLAGLGVTEKVNRHMLSYGMLEALGLSVSTKEFEHAIASFNERLQSTLRESVVPAIGRLRHMAASVA